MFKLYQLTRHGQDVRFSMHLQRGPRTQWQVVGANFASMGISELWREGSHTRDIDGQR